MYFSERKVTSEHAFFFILRILLIQLPLRQPVSPDFFALGGAAPKWDQLRESFPSAPLQFSRKRTTSPNAARMPEPSK